MVDDQNDIIPSLVVADVGNQAVKIAKADPAGVSDVHAFSLSDLSDLPATLMRLLDELTAPRYIVAASVNPAGLRGLTDAAETLGENVLTVGEDLPLPIEADLPEPQAIGPDRLCAAAAAWDRLQQPCVVADFGTAITIDCVNDKETFLGGAILPGLAISSAGLSDGTAGLPHVELRDPDWVYGKTTEQAIIGGIVFGARGAMRELVEAYATDLGAWPLVIATGGNARLICGDIRQIGIVQAIVDDLTLRGVAIAYYRTLMK